MIIPISKNVVKNTTESKYVIDPVVTTLTFVGLLLADIASSAIEEK
jgi:hypothetical protein